MTGVSLRLRGREYLALPGGIAQLRAGGTSGLPLLAPWANRLASRRYRAAGVTSISTGCRWGPTTTACRSTACSSVRRVGRGPRRCPRQVRPPPRVDRCRRAGVPVPAPDRGRRDRTRRRARRRDHRHPHGETTGSGRLRMAPVPPVAGRSSEPMVAEPAGATARGARPARHPDRRRSTPSRRSARRSDVGRSMISMCSVGNAGSPSKAEDGTAIELRCDSAYPYAQVWVPRGKTYGALEPMAAPTNALRSRLGAARRAWRLVHGAVRTGAQVSSSRRSLAMIRPAASISARWENACGKLPRW